MHVHAHPDDESSKGAARTAKYVAEGVDVHVVTCTGGERGSILNPSMDRPDVLANMAEIRRQEMERAREILGVRQDWLGFVDSGWPEGDPKPPLPEGCFAPGRRSRRRAAPLVRLIRDFRPHVITTYDENGGYPHPDHIMCHVDHDAGLGDGGRPETPIPDAGEPWQPLKLYYHHTFHRAADRWRSTRRCSRAAWSPRTPSGSKEWKDGPGARAARSPPACRARSTSPSATGPCIAHATQIDPDGSWFAVPLEVQPAGVADRGLRAGREPGRRPTSRRTTCSPVIRDLADELRRPPREHSGMTTAVLLGVRPEHGQAGLDRVLAGRRAALRRDLSAVAQHEPPAAQDRRCLLGRVPATDPRRSRVITPGPRPARCAEAR